MNSTLHAANLVGQASLGHVHVSLRLSAIIFFLCFFSMASAQRMWINEFHYDDALTDENEFVEIFVEEGADLSQVQLQLFDGADGQPYGSLLTIDPDFTEGATVSCFKIYSAAIPGIENGVDGLALLYQGIVVQFLSYEGSFVGQGDAAGYLSQNVGVSENEDPEGSAIGLTGTGTNFGDFTFAKAAATPGQPNIGQSFPSPTLSATLTDTPEAPATEPVGRGDIIEYEITIENTGQGDAKGVTLDRATPLDPNTTVDLTPGSFTSTPIAYDVFALNVVEDNAKIIDLKALDLDGNGGADLSFSITNGPTNGTLGTVTQNGPSAATVEYTPVQDYFGPDQFEFTVTDADNNTSTGIVQILVQPVNDPPTITCGPDQTLGDIPNLQIVPGWATNISVGPANESFQMPVINVVNQNATTGLFVQQPSINAVTGNLSFEGDTSSLGGIANFEAIISDGISTATCPFSITVQDRPKGVRDIFFTVEDTDLSGNLFVDNGAGADRLGFPAATLVSFGGGDLGGNVTTNAPGATLTNSAIGGGNLTVNANGDITLTGQPFTTGTFTFFYRLQNPAGISDPRVTITILPPDDAPTVASVNPADNATDVAVNTNIVVTFSEAVNANATAFTLEDAGNNPIPFTLSGGPTVFTLDPDADLPNFEQITLTVLAANVTDQDAIDPPDNMAADFVSTFTTIGLPPVCVDNGPAAGSFRGDDFHTAFNTTLNAADGSSEDLLVNDDLGAPTATLTEFGATNALGALAGSMSTSANGGALTVNADGSFSYTPPSNFTGLDDFFYKIENTYGSSVCQATIAVGERPSCTNDVYTGTGNIAIDINAANGILINDVGDGIAIELIQGAAPSFGVATAATNGSVTMQSDGSFVFEPTAGATTGSFTYTIDNGFNNPQTCTATINFSNMVWFIDNSGAGNNTGTFLNPFQSIAAFNASAGPGAGHLISLASGTYNEADGINLQNSQTLIGEGVQLSSFFTADGNSVAAYQTFAAGTGTRPQISTTGAGNHGVDLASGNTVRGLNVGNTTGYGFNGGAVGTLTIADVNVTGTGGAIKIATSGSFGSSVNFGELSSSTSAEDGISLTGVSGTLGVTSGSISNPTRHAVFVSGGSVSFTYPGAVTKTTAGPANNGIVVANHSGTLTFNGAVTLGTTAARLTAIAVNLTANTGGTYNLFGGLGVATNGATGFNASGGGTVNITGAANTANTTSGTAVIISSTTIGGSGVTFLSVNASGSTKGIVLNSAGSGGFTVTGTGTTDASGGTIQNMTQRGVEIISTNSVNLKNMALTNAATTASGSNCFSAISAGTNTGCFSSVHLQSSTGITLDNVDITGSVQHGINGYQVTNLTISNSNLQNLGDGNDDHGVKLFNLFGASSISGTTINNSFSDNLRVQNNTNTSLTLTISNSIFTNSTAGQGIQFSGRANAVMNLLLQNSTLSGNFSSGIQPQGSDDVNASGGSFDFQILGNNFANNGAAAIDMGFVGNSPATFKIQNNGTTLSPIINHGSNVINVNQGGNSTTPITTALVQGLISNNVIGSGPNNSGTTVGSGIRIVENQSGTMRVNVDGNTVKGWTEYGIFVVARDASAGAGSGSSDVDVTITNNTVNDPNGMFPIGGIFVQSGAVNTVDEVHNVCAVIQGNTVVAGLAEGIRLRQRFNTTMTLFKSSSPSATAAAILADLNPAATGTPNTNATGTITISTTACALPTN